ncbi:hypothetical protein VOLCADRAFT_88993 [Volvox carteri f. nagariensis]|uniref:F-box domain-containing protein n=1 Tax=Volvox carteri f. nagariensis TaxID=3068 RepID=D8TQI1_VOLCA|nr:uncharacterized protein VOLCADRAFT_88993 [Volvox carteri f. nagariensis]EFJ50036.1 hypothetical protein VOLCADRAFT_88993 [Volvox carteri f. nagariensis]|eukprot:XP_002948656.1 hypothetical protein VOLCADRAFT_88993 [Volvox carteri f. nagariensis]
MASHRHQHAPDWSALPTELLLEVAKLLLPSQLGSFALVSRAWRQAVLPLVTVLHVPLLSSITLPSGPAGSQQIEVVEQYLDFLKQQQRQPQHQRQQVQQNSRAGESANQTTQENAPIHGKGYGHGCGSNGTHNSNHASAHSDGIGDVDAKNRQRGATAGSADCGGLSATTRPSLAASQPSTNADIGLSLHPGISPPLMQHLLSRFPFVRTVGMHRSQLQHPRLEVAALQGLSTCQPTVSQLHMYDTLAWDFPQQLTNLGALTQLVTLKLWSLGAPGLDPSAQLPVRLSSLRFSK